MKSLFVAFSLMICSGLQANALQRDTTYKRGIFLVEVAGKTNIDVIRQGAHIKHKTSKGDTIFENEKYVVLGDDINLTVYGLFKKAYLKYKFPAFSTPVYKGKLAKPDFTTDKEAYSFRTHIRTQCITAGVNFAGLYTY